MKWKNYLGLCLLLSVGFSASILFVPGLSETLEGVLLGFLSTNAS